MDVRRGAKGNFSIVINAVMTVGEFSGGFFLEYAKGDVYGWRLEVLRKCWYNKDVGSCGRAVDAV